MDTNEVKSLSIIVAYHNEPRLFIQKCIDQILDTIDVPEWEIIVVDDASYRPLAPIYGTTIIRHPDNRGVGAAFDTGVKAAKYQNVMLLGCDTRFIANNWTSKMVDEIENNPKALTCTLCVKLGRSELNERFATDITNQLQTKKYGLGATIKMLSSGSIIDAQWLPLNGSTEHTPSYEVPCILGAAYGVKKSWYQYIDGFNGHKKWGTLEPLISLKSWMFGGSCRVAPGIQIGHIFNLTNKHNVHSGYRYYNKFMVATMFIPGYERYMQHYNREGVPKKAGKIIQETMPWLMEKKKEYTPKITMTFDEFCRKFNINNTISNEKNISLS